MSERLDFSWDDFPRYKQLGESNGCALDMRGFPERLTFIKDRVRLDFRLNQDEFGRYFAAWANLGRHWRTGVKVEISILEAVVEYFGSNPRQLWDNFRDGRWNDENK